MELIKFQYKTGIDCKNVASKKQIFDYIMILVSTVIEYISCERVEYEIAIEVIV